MGKPLARPCYERKQSLFRARDLKRRLSRSKYDAKLVFGVSMRHIRGAGTREQRRASGAAVDDGKASTTSAHVCISVIMAASKGPPRRIVACLLSSGTLQKACLQVAGIHIRLEVKTNEMVHANGLKIPARPKARRF